MKLYLVSDGSYSDYRILGIYSSMELAERARALFNADNELESWDLDAIPDHPPGLLPWIVDMDRDGNSKSTRRRSMEGHDNYPWCPSHYDNLVSYYVWAENEAHAVKIANERRVQLIASGDYTESWDHWHYHILPRYEKD